MLKVISSYFYFASEENTGQQIIRKHIFHLGLSICPVLFILLRLSPSCLSQMRTGPGTMIAAKPGVGNTQDIKNILSLSDINAPNSFYHKLHASV